MAQVNIDMDPMTVPPGVELITATAPTLVMTKYTTVAEVVTHTVKHGMCVCGSKEKDRSYVFIKCFKNDTWNYQMQMHSHSHSFGTANVCVCAWVFSYQPDAREEHGKERAGSVAMEIRVEHTDTRWTVFPLRGQKRDKQVQIRAEEQEHRLQPKNQFYPKGHHLAVDFALGDNVFLWNKLCPSQKSAARDMKDLNESRSLQGKT